MYENALLQGLIAVKPDFDVVLSRSENKPLIVPVEVVDDADERLVHVDLSFITEFLRTDLNPDLPVIGTVCPITIGVVTTIPITVTGVAMAVAVTVTMAVAVTVTMPVVVPILRKGLGW